MRITVRAYGSSNFSWNTNIFSKYNFLHRIYWISEFWHAQAKFASTPTKSWKSQIFQLNKKSIRYKDNKQSESKNDVTTGEAKTEEVVVNVN